MKRNVAVEIAALADSLDHYVEQSDKEAFDEYLHSCANVIYKCTKISYRQRWHFYIIKDVQEK